MFEAKIEVIALIYSQLILKYFVKYIKSSLNIMNMHNGIHRFQFVSEDVMQDLNEIIFWKNFVNYL